MLPVVTSFLLAVLGVADGLSVAELRFVVAALPFVTLSAFWSGVAVWRYLADGSPRYGAIGGVAATCLTYLVSTGFLFPVVVFIGHEWLPLSVSTAAGYTLLTAVIGTILTGWMALPAGVAAGYVYESARVQHRSS